MRTSTKNLLLLLAAAQMSACDKNDDTDEAADGDSTSTTGDGDGDSAACKAYGDYVTSCTNAGYGEGATQTCLYQLGEYEMYYGADCGDAYETLYTCLSALTCDQLSDSGDVCGQEFDAMDMLCGSPPP